MPIKISLCCIIARASLFFCIFLAFDQNFLYANSLSKEQIFAIDGVEKSFKTKHGSLINTRIAEYNFNQNIKKFVRFAGNYVVDSCNATINYQFTEMTPSSINEVVSQLLTSFDMQADSADLCTAIYVKNFEINFIMNNINFFNIKSERCEIIPDKKNLLLNNVKSNNSVLNNRNFFLLDHKNLIMLLKTSYFHNKQFNSN